MGKVKEQVSLHIKYTQDSIGTVHVRKPTTIIALNQLFKEEWVKHIFKPMYGTDKIVKADVWVKLLHLKGTHHILKANDAQ